jgi:hypothetical protein
MLPHKLGSTRSCNTRTHNQTTSRTALQLQVLHQHHTRLLNGHEQQPTTALPHVADQYNTGKQIGWQTLLMTLQMKAANKQMTCIDNSITWSN